MNLLKIIVTLSFNFLTFFASGQKELKDYVQTNAVRFSTIDPDSTNYSDLEAIGAAIGNARIVMLGDQDHGDAPGFSAKIRLVRYLHETKGFNVLAFENDFINTNYCWKLVNEGTLSFQKFMETIAVNWKVCTAAPLFEGYLPANLKRSSPLQIAGFDSYTSTPQTLTLLDSLCKYLQLPITQTEQYLKDIYPLLQLWYNHAGDSVTMKENFSYYQQIRTQLLQKLPSDDFWIKAVDNLQTNTSEFSYKQGNWHSFQDRNIRDSQMAENLKWLSRVKYVERRLLCGLIIIIYQNMQAVTLTLI